jgi:hypothetical protein
MNRLHKVLRVDVSANFGKDRFSGVNCLKNVLSTTFVKIYLSCVFCEGRLYNLSNLIGDGIG